MNYSKRANLLGAHLEGKGLLGAILFSPENIFYMTGAPFVRGSMGKILFVDKNGLATLIVTALDYEEARSTVRDAEVVKTDFMERPLDRLKKMLPKKSKIGYEEGVLSAGMKERIGAEFELEPVGEVLERMRERKDDREIALIEGAQAINDRAFERTVSNLAGGMSELEIAAELEYMLRREGAEAFAFETIVASGPRGVFPHGMPSTRRPGRGEAVVIDFGSKLGGYCSDMTRTIFFGDPPEDAKKAYAAVKQAQEDAIGEAKEGVTGKGLDEIARRTLERSALANYFVHGLGHGVGIDIHEQPVVGASNERPLTEGNVITIEPGVYIPGRFGIRIEDMIVVKGDRAIDLTKFTREMIII